MINFIKCILLQITIKATLFASSTSLVFDCNTLMSSPQTALFKINNQLVEVSASLQSSHYLILSEKTLDDSDTTSSFRTYIFDTNTKEIIALYDHVLNKYLGDLSTPPLFKELVFSDAKTFKKRDKIRKGPKVSDGVDTRKSWSPLLKINNVKIIEPEFLVLSKKCTHEDLHGTDITLYVAKDLFFPTWIEFTDMSGGRLSMRAIHHKVHQSNIILNLPPENIRIINSFKHDSIFTFMFYVPKSYNNSVAFLKNSDGILFDVTTLEKKDGLIQCDIDTQSLSSGEYTLTLQSTGLEEQTVALTINL